MSSSNSMLAESDRDRLVADLAAESGAAWADIYRPGTTGCHELLDRISLVADMLERYVVEHPACIAQPDWYGLAERAAALVHELYQQVGAEHLTAEDPSDSEEV